MHLIWVLSVHAFNLVFILCMYLIRILSVEIFGGMDGNNWIELDEKREAWEQKRGPCGGKPD